MKKLIAIPLMLLALYASSQDRFTLSAFTEFPDKNTHNEKFDYGPNLGVQIEYQGRRIFLDVEAYFFPELNGVGYTHFQGTVLGINFLTRYEDWRFYGGLIKPGFIIRGGYPYPMIGQDLGVEKYFDDFYIGIQYGHNYSVDDKYWGSDSGIWRQNISIRFGFIFKKL